MKPEKENIMPSGGLEGMDFEPSEADQKPLKVAGYKDLTQERVDKVNNFKAREEQILRALDEMKNDLSIDQRWLSIGRTKLEEAFMSINRSIFRPDRHDNIDVV